MGSILRRGSEGAEVVRLQKSLNAQGASPQLIVDGVFGRATEAAVRAFQAAKAPPVDGIVGPKTWSALAKPAGPSTPARPAPPPAPTPPPPAPGGRGLRDAIVQAARLALAHEPEVHYSQGPRRMEFIRLDLRPPQFPTYTDCSAFATWCYWSAGAPDPNGAGYNGTGYTGTLIQHGTRTTNPQPGDLAFYGVPVNHVAVCVGDGRVISHGSEGGPYDLAIGYRTVNQVRSYL